MDLAEFESQATVGIASESILIREGYYVGRTFCIGTGEGEIRATWFMEPDELKIRELDGSIIVVFSGEEIYAVETPAVVAQTDVVEEVVADSQEPAEEIVTEEAVVEEESTVAAEVEEADEQDSGPVSIPMTAAAETVDEESDVAAETEHEASASSEPEQGDGLSKAA
ncbi:hypothetical protein CGZ80_07985 [Rhodopirellula sp. MGV]|nr:hypothetical protein CGZ80_07985 [Rhodopirellula sp. MGV]